MKIDRFSLRYTLFFSLCVLTALLLVPRVNAAGKFKLKPGAEGKICLKCHETFQKTVKSRSVHPLAKTGKCAGCHDPHTSSHQKLLDSNPADLCFSCHKDVLPENASSTHSIVTEGNCAKCHDSHASENKFILAKSGNELCLECHQEIGERAGKARFKHNPLMRQKGCLNCHNPHASTESDFLLSADVPGLCLKCHKTNKLSFKRKHMNYPVANTNCDSCHSTHGSNKRGILYDTVHAPVAQKKCTECHLSATSPKAVETKKQGIELCRQCHRDIIDETFSKNRVHWALADKVACSNCHSPHGSKEKKLLKRPVIETCGACHSDTVALQEWSKNNPKNKNLCEPVKKGDCTSCHSPHAADNVLLIAQENITSGVCGKCHEWKSHSSHPLGEKVLDPRNKNLTVECLSCHRACGTGNNPAMLPYESTYDLCVQCHPERRR